MLVEISKVEKTKKKIEIPLRELRYLLKETFDIELPKDVSMEFVTPGPKAKTTEAKVILKWEEFKDEEYADLVLSKSASDEVRSMHEKVKDTYKTPEDLVRAGLETALAHDLELKSNSKKGRKSKNAKRDSNRKRS